MFIGEIDMSKESSLNTNLNVLFVGKPFILGICKCPCKERHTSSHQTRHCYSAIKHGHNWKIKENNPSKKGAENHNWNGGLIYDGDGYLMRYCPDHPNSNAIGYVREHRLLWKNILVDI